MAIFGVIFNYCFREKTYRSEILLFFSILIALDILINNKVCSVTNDKSIISKIMRKNRFFLIEEIM